MHKAYDYFMWRKSSLFPEKNLVYAELSERQPSTYSTARGRIRHGLGLDERAKHVEHRTIDAAEPVSPSRSG